MTTPSLKLLQEQNPTITVQQLAEELKMLAPQPLHVYLAYIGEHVPWVRLANGCRITDAIACQQLHEELAKELRS